MMKIERLLTVSEIAELLNVSPSFIYKKVQRKKIPYHKVGRSVRFFYSEVKKWLTN